MVNLQNYLTTNPKLIDSETMQNLNKTIKSYNNTFIKAPKLHNKVCDENFTLYSNIPEDLVDQLKSWGLIGEVAEATPETV
ncbi:MAG: hypothetical protein ACIPMY_06000 [Rickettsia endosymbiont of Pentastiridius leporinus]